MNRTFPQRARGAKENISAGAVRGVTNPDRGSDLYGYICPVSRPHTDHAGYLYDGIIWTDFAHHDLSLLVIENSPARVIFSPEVILLPVSASGMAMKSKGDTTLLPVPACEKAAKFHTRAFLIPVHVFGWAMPVTYSDACMLAAGIPMRGGIAATTNSRVMLLFCSSDSLTSF